MNADLQARTTPGAEVKPLGPGAWRLAIPAGPRGRYRLAQLDDYAKRSRAELPWRPPLTLALQARTSTADLRGTWGFGFWNDPFSFALGLGGASRRLPALPNATWFFFASPPNFLSLRDDLPAQGGLAATFQSPHTPTALSLLAAPALPLLALPPLARWLRRVGRRVVRQDAAQLPATGPAGHTHSSPTPWRDYSLQWTHERVVCHVDGRPVLDTPITPLPPLGVVLWVDNQFAALPPDGRFRMGTLQNPAPAWVELRELSLTAG